MSMKQGPRTYGKKHERKRIAREARKRERQEVKNLARD